MQVIFWSRITECMGEGSLFLTPRLQSRDSQVEVNQAEMGLEVGCPDPQDWVCPASAQSRHCPIWWHLVREADVTAAWGPRAEACGAPPAVPTSPPGIMERSPGTGPL